MDISIVALIIVIISRIFLPLIILKKPLLGGILAMIADAVDVMIFEAVGGGYPNYHLFDKSFDMWYLFLEFLVVLKWKDLLAKRTGSVLFIWRFVGFALFEITSYKGFFFFAPNIFEFFFLATLVILKFKKSFRYNAKSLTIVLLIVGVPNIIKEYLMHYKYPNQTWDYLRDKLFWWIYN